MKKEHKTVAYDETLQIEAYRLDRITQPFPNHFHEYYVIGFVARGGALLTCKNQEFHVDTGSVVLFQPGDNHGRVKIDESTMDYWGLNIPQETMLTLTEEVTGKRELPGFTVNVLLDEEVNCYLRPLHEMIMAGAGDLDKEENLLLLISLLLRRYGQPFSRSIPPCRDEIECACRFIEEHYAERLVLSAPIKSGRKRWGIRRVLCLRGVGSFADRSAIGSGIENIATRRLLLRDRRVRLRLPHVRQVAC